VVSTVGSVLGKITRAHLVSFAVAGWKSTCYDFRPWFFIE